MSAATPISSRSSPASGDPHPSSPEEVGHLLPEYEVLSILGNGGMGAVYLAMQKMLDRPVALKLLARACSDRPGYAQRFTHEARAMARLHHPGIATIYDFGQTAEGRLYLVMEFIEGTNLAEVLARRGLSVDEALRLAGDVCETLAFAHQHGVVHRDIKPANVMLEKGGRARIVDFGLARLEEAVPGRGVTVTGTVLGTPGYMAPEQQEGQVADHRADLFSTGVLLYEMLCGRLPQALGLPPSSLSGCSRRVDAVIFKALQPDPAERYQTAGEMQKALQSAACHRPWRWAAWPPRGRLALLVAAGLLASAFAGWLLRARHPHPPGSSVEVDAREAGVPAHEATAAHPFVNSLGMCFVPVPITGGPTNGQRVLFSVWETRIMDYERFAKATQTAMDPGHFYRTSAKPVEMVTWVEAGDFARWLTQGERETGRLPVGLAYRLPSDHEWSCAIGIGTLEDPALSPEAKHALLTKVYPWGGAWPPPERFGNYGSEELQSHPRQNPTLPGYHDGYAYTAPVGSYPPNKFGLYDLSGNVLEWCEDRFRGADSDQRVMRGGAYYSSRLSELRSSSRLGEAPDRRRDSTGFRLVLAPVPEAAR